VCVYVCVYRVIISMHYLSPPQIGVIIIKMLHVFMSQVPSLLFVSSHAVSVITLGIPSGLVIDCGYAETVVLPVS